MTLVSDLYIYNTLDAIRETAYKSLIVEGPDWRIQREKALHNIMALVDAVVAEKAPVPNPLERLVEQGRAEWVKIPARELGRGSDEYLNEWDVFIQPLAEFLGIEPYGFDPTVSYTQGNKMVQLPTWFVELFNKKLEEKSDRRLWIAIYTHRFGNEVIPYILPATQVLTQKTVIEGLSDWEGDTREDEHLDIAGPYHIDQIGQA